MSGHTKEPTHKDTVTISREVYDWALSTMQSSVKRVNEFDENALCDEYKQFLAAGDKHE